MNRTILVGVLLAGWSIASSNALALPEAKEWIPTDNDAKGFHASKNQVAVAYQYRIEFFSFPESVQFFIAADSSWKKRDLKTGQVTNAEVPKTTPSKILTFKRHLQVYPRNWQKYSGSNLLVCTNFESWYSPTTPFEFEQVKAKGYRYGMPWVDPAGEFDRFCGIVDLAGNVIYEIPVREKEPDVLFKPLDIIGEGKRAAVLIGRETFEEGDERTIRFAGQFYEMLIWEFPDKLRRVPLKEKNLPYHVWLRRFEKGAL